MAQLHRTGSARTQKAIDLAIESANAWGDFTMVEWALSQ